VSQEFFNEDATIPQLIDRGVQRIWVDHKNRVLCFVLNKDIYFSPDFPFDLTCEEAGKLMGDVSETVCSDKPI